MQSNRVLGFALLLLIAAAAAFAVWQFGFGGAQTAPTAPSSASSGQGQVVPAAGVVDESPSSGAPAPATADGLVERTAAPASAAFDESKPAIVGRVVGPEGRPIAGAKVVTAPGMGFANANGRMDFDTFDFSDFEDLDMGDMSKMTSMLREQLADRIEVTTDADGRFRAPAKGTSRAVGLRVLARGFAILDRRVDRPSERDQDVGTLTLQQSAVVSGRVLEAGGAPIVGAQVSRVHEMETRWLGGVDIDMPEMGEIEALRGGETAVTDESGRFELPHLAPGDLVLRARHPDHPVARSESMPLEAGRERRDVLITMQRGGEIRGVVLDLPADVKGLQVMASKVQRADANPAAGMLGALGDMSELLSEMGMSFGERNADIAADGKFVLRGLARDTYRVWVGRKGPGFAGSSAYSAKVEAMPGSAVELRYEPGISVTFTVVDSKSGAPVERLWVRDRLRGGDGFGDLMAMGMPSRQVRAAHYPGGAVTVANLRPKAKQKLELTIDATGYDSFERRDIELPRTGNLDLGRLELAPTPVVQVTVVTAEVGRPIAGATVRVEHTGSGAGAMRRFGAFANLGQGSGPRVGKSDSDGRCTLNRPSAGESTIEVDLKGFAPFASEVITFTTSGPDTFTARLFVGGTVAVTVADTADKPVKDVAVEHRAPGGDTASRKSDAQGLVRFEHLAPGTHSFRLAKDAGPMAMLLAARGGAAGDDSPWQTIDVADRATGALKLVKQPTAALRGVVRENGLPLEGARVSFREGTQESEADAGMDAVGEMMGAVGGGMNKRSAKTDERGLYALTELPEGQHRLHVTHKGRALPAKLALTLRNGENTFDIELDMTTVRGVVNDPQGKPFEGARVRVRKVAPNDDPTNDLPQGIGDAMEGMMPGVNLGSSIKTDANGVFELRGVEPDVELLVQVSAKGFAPASGKVTASRGATKEIAALQLGAAGKVKVTVADAGPFGGVMATYVGEGDKVPPVMGMLRRGKGTLDGLRPGRWEISMPDMRNRGGDANAQTPERKKIVEVVAGETVEVEL